ncbi:MAG: hypothetical protein KKD64_15395 [Alphaproteobacteria bacterium]|nr:hypothetical protein [Alphaproteobacteria bacterium]MBU0793614.1 hypothetical protein [Alphaproteobacteria bacterium]MBU0876132.1 hypothetical protein [Alphaproteobacteria bacterium]MBU1771023.1 hypothetical protein [Alphaproteobacteria bacterium]
MTVAGERLAGFAAWLDRSSKAWRSPCGDSVPVGRYAEILPWDFDELPTVDFAEHALPLFVPMDQATGVALPADADLSHPPGQLRAFHRLSHIIFRLEDARLALSPPWRATDDRLPLCAVIGLTDPEMALWDAVDAAGGADVDLDAFPLLAVPLWAMSAKERAEISGTLPFLPD